MHEGFQKKPVGRLLEVPPGPGDGNVPSVPCSPASFRIGKGKGEEQVSGEAAPPLHACERFGQKKSINGVQKNGEQNTPGCEWLPGAAPRATFPRPPLLVFSQSGTLVSGGSSGRREREEPRLGAKVPPWSWPQVLAPRARGCFASRFGLALLCVFSFGLWTTIVGRFFFGPALGPKKGQHFAPNTQHFARRRRRCWCRFAVPGVAVALPRSRGKTHAHEGSRSWLNSGWCVPCVVLCQFCGEEIRPPRKSNKGP